MKILSICIASYNKSDITTRLVKSILTCKSSELEVVAVDNASPDNTVELLNTINDDRLRVIQNKENIGGARNLIKSLFEAKSLFCLYVNDRDVVFPDQLDDFISFLKNHHNIGGGHCVRKIVQKGVDFIEHHGVEALLSINFKAAHPTGFFFRRELLDSIPQKSIDKYVDAMLFTPFPYENLLCEIICKGYSVVEYNRVIWRSTGNETHNKYVSGFVKIDKGGDRWFYPGNCLRRTIENVEDTLRLCKENGIVLSEIEKYKLYAHLLDHQYRLGVYRYKIIHETPTLATHYAVKCRKIDKDEVLKCRSEILDGYFEYIREKNGGYNRNEKYITDLISKVDKDKQERPFIDFLSRMKHFIVKKIM